MLITGSGHQLQRRGPRSYRTQRLRRKGEEFGSTLIWNHWAQHAFVFSVGRGWFFLLRGIYWITSVYNALFYLRRTDIYSNTPDAWVRRQRDLFASPDPSDNERKKNSRAGVFDSPASQKLWQELGLQISKREFTGCLFPLCVGVSMYHPVWLIPFSIGIPKCEIRNFNLDPGRRVQF